MLFILLALFITSALAQGSGLLNPNITESCVYRDNPTKSPCKDERYTCDRDTKTCVLKQCKYDLDDTNSHELPLCPDSSYCPYDQTKCLAKIALGDACSLKRGDVCQGTSDIMCFQGSCSVKSATLGSSCEIDYVSNYVYDNCLGNSFCSADTMLCAALLSQGESCSDNSQCQSTDCFQGKCRVNNDTELYHPLAIWVYAVIGVCCFVAVLLFALFVYFRRRRRMRNYKQMLNVSMVSLDESNPNQNSNSSFPELSLSLDSSTASQGR